MKVLIVEDDKLSSRLLETLLADRATECHVVRDGDEAYEKFCDALDLGDPYDLICLDLHLETTSGVEFLNGIRQYEEAHGVVASAGVKVIVISGDKDTHSIYDALSAGCTSYLMKPLDRHKFMGELARLGFM